MTDIICQIAIVLFGCSSIYLVCNKKSSKNIGFVLGFLGQPFWLYSTFINKQWGMFILACWYTFAWSQGIYNFWIKESK